MDKFAKRRDPAFGHASAEEASLHKIIMSDPASFERGLLAAIIYDHRIAVTAEPLVLKDQYGMPIEDFVVPMHQALYTAIQRYHVTTNYAFYATPSMDGVRLELMRVAGDRDCMLTEDQIPFALQAFAEACRHYHSAPQYFSEITRKGLAYWLQERRLSEYHKKKAALGWTSVQFTQEWATEQIHLKSMAGQDEEKLWYSIDDCLQWAPIEVFLNFPWQGINNRMGGGLARGDATLIVGATGAGKTVVASQVTGHFVLTCGAKGVFISTEQKGPGVLPRLVSCFSHVPFSQLNEKRTIQLDALPPAARKKAEETLLRLRAKNFYFRDWRPGDSIVSGIKSIVEHYCERISPDGSLDFVVMDWIGGSIEHGANDKDEVRMRMQHAADTIALLADELNIVTVATAQAHPLQAARTAQVGGQHIAECKTMHRHFENLIGISGLQDVKIEEGSDSIAARYLNEQYLYIDKSRFGPGGSVPVSRMFATQRLEERYGRQG